MRHFDTSRAPTLPKIFRPITRNTLWPKVHRVVVAAVEDRDMRTHVQIGTPLATFGNIRSDRPHRPTATSLIKYIHGHTSDAVVS